MMSALKEHGGKWSAARTMAFLLLPLVYYAVVRCMDWRIVASLVGGGIVSLMSRSRGAASLFQPPVPSADTPNAEGGNGD